MALSERANSIAAWLAARQAGPRIVGEVVPRRTRTSKTFRNQDGTFTTVVHAKPIHYQPAGPSWREIDNRWEPSSRPGFAWEMTRCWYRAWVADDLRADPFLRIEHRGQVAEYRLGEVRWRTAARTERVGDVPDVRIGRAAGKTLEVDDFLASGVTLRVVACAHRLRIRADIPESALASLPACGLQVEPGDDLELTVQLVRKGLHGLASGDPIYGETGDGQIEGDHTDYATARSTSASCFAAAPLAVGQRYDGVTFHRYVKRSYVSFDTSGIPDGETVLSAALYLRGKEDASDTEFDVKVYRYAWAEALCDNQEANYDGAYGGSATLEGTLLNTSSFAVETWFNLSVATGGVNKTGDSKYASVSSRDVDATGPTGNEYVVFYSADEAGTDKDPKLVVTWGIPVTVTPPAATATAEAPAPTMSMGVSIQPPAATATAEATAPTITINIIVQPPAATATAEALTPAKVYGLTAVNEFALGTSSNEQRMAHGDCVMTAQHSQIVRETRTAAGSLKRDTIATKRSFSFVYSWIPGQNHNVPDGGMGRDDLLALFEAGGEYSFHLPTEDDLPEDVTVMFDAQSWNETLLQRDGPFGWVWVLSFRLLEV